MVMVIGKSFNEGSPDAKVGNAKHENMMASN